MGQTNYDNSYDDHGRIATVAQGASRVYTFTYDASGNLDTVTDPLSRTMSFDYDLAGRMTKQVLPDLREIYVSYDPDGNVTTIQPPGRPVHTFSYTSVNLEEQYTPPDIGIGPPQTLYTYNLDRQLTQVLRPDGKTIDLSYNATTGFLETISIPRGQISLTYRPGTGYIQTMTAPGNETLTFTYNQSLQTGTTFSGTINGSITRTYDNDFRITSQSINGSNIITYQYDEDGLLTQAGDLTIARDPQNGLITGTTLGNVTDTIDYTDLIDGNNYGEVAHYHAQFNTDPLFDVTYKRDSLGRITKKTETIDGASHLFEYSYYPTGWLHQVKKDGEYISTYTCDSNGNRLTHTTPGGTVTATYDDQDRLIQYGDATYTYTANGELETKTENGQTTTYTYDVLGNLTRVDLPDGTVIEYLIDATNRRIGKKVNGTLTQGFLYDSQLHPIADFDSSGQIVSIFGSGFMIRNGTTYRFITDHLGSIRRVVDDTTGQIVQELTYDEFGIVITDTNPGFQPFGFAGGVYDLEQNLVRFGERDYDSKIGRWNLKDRILFSGGDLNLYGYVVNDPINYFDPFGTVVIVNRTNRVIWVLPEHGKNKKPEPVQPGQPADVDGIYQNPRNEIQFGTDPCNIVYKLAGRSNDKYSFGAHASVIERDGTLFIEYEGIGATAFDYWYPDTGWHDRDWAKKPKVNWPIPEWLQICPKNCEK